MFVGTICPVKSQNTVKISPDTIVVYDTKIVYDTIFVYDTIRISKPIKGFTKLPLEFTDTLSVIKPFLYDSLLMVDTILIDKMKKKYYYTLHQRKHLGSKPLTCLSKDYFIQPEEILCELPATNLKKNIISVKTNKKLMKSERYSTTDTHQNSWGISAGGGGWWARSFDGNLRTNALISPQIGVYYEKKIVSNLVLKMELNYRWIEKNGLQFSQDSFLDFIQSPSTVGITESDVFSWDVDGKTEDEFVFSQIDIPLKVGYDFGLLQPYIGLDYTRRFKHNNVHNGNYFNVLVGANIHLSNRFSLELSYSHGVREEIQRDGQVLGIIEGNIITLPHSKVVFSSYPPAEYVLENTGKLSSRRVGISLLFNLHSN